jgi:hypothetical protein
MVWLAGLSGSEYENERVADTSPPTDYYVAHLLLLPNEPGPEEATPFYFASIDLCKLAPYLELILNTPPSVHGYARLIHRHNYAAAVFHRFSYFLIPVYAKNFNREYAESLGRYLAKVIYVSDGVPLELLDNVSHYDNPPVVIAETSECAMRANELRLPCYRLDQITPKQINSEIRRQFSRPAQPLTAAELDRMAHGQFERHIPPDEFIATAPQECLWEESNLRPFPASGLRLMLPNEALSNQLRRRYMPQRLLEQPDPVQRMDQLIESARTIFGQRLSDYLLEDPQSEIPDRACPSSLREKLERYEETGSGDDYEALVREAEQHVSSFPEASSFVLCCPAINKKSSERIFRRSVPDRVLKALYKAEASNFRIDVREEDFHTAQEYQQFQALGYYRKLENAYLSTVLALYAVSYRRPVLRTPQLSSALFGMLRSLRTTYDGGNMQAFVRDLHKFSAELLASLPLQVRELLESTTTRDFKLISDLPLEWLPVDDVPLMYCRTLSRMPLTPGNALFSHANVCRENLFIGPEEAQRVLICNCMSPDDPLFPHPLIQSEVLKGMGLQHVYAEPAGVEQYVAALRDHKPYILVHWGHGSYDRLQDRGYLHVRNEKTEIWDLKGCAVPPIVLLAACETAAIAETHNNPANGWLALGARSVLATYFPVQADLTTSIFTRIFSYLTEAVRGNQRLKTWAAIVSKTLILSRYSDFLYGFVDWLKKRGLPTPPADVFSEYTFLWNQKRGSLEEGYRLSPVLLEQALGHFSSELRDKFREYRMREAIVPHTMFFTHLGAPETIIIRKEQPPNGDENSAALAYWEMRASQERKLG